MFIFNFFLKNPTIIAIGLAMGTCIALSFTRFSYSLFLPSMQADLSWDYLIAGSMNTANALGYLLGAIFFPFFVKNFGARFLFIFGGFFTSIFIGICGLFTDSFIIFSTRLLAGIFSALIFISGGLLISQLSMKYQKQSGWLIGIYYSGGGLGIIISSFLIPFIINTGQSFEFEYPWQLAWLILGILSLFFSFLMWISSNFFSKIILRQITSKLVSHEKFYFISIAYFLFGLGYIGYITFIISFLNEMEFDNSKISFFYACLGFFVILSSKFWSRFLDKYKGGECLGIINLILGFSCLIPNILAINSNINTGYITTILVFLSGALFGLCIFSAVASTTAFIKHNFSEKYWVKIITIFTCVFGVGQIIGPSMTGFISDNFSLGYGFLFSSLLLFVGSVFAFLQRPLLNK